MTQVDTNLYRMEERSLFHEVLYHDIVEAERQDNGSLRIIRVAKPSGLMTATWMVPKGFIEAPLTAALLKKVMELGGNWELTFGGFLATYLPASEAVSIQQEIDAAVKDFNRNAAAPPFAESRQADSRMALKSVFRS
jgi:hypothetical protein